MKELKNIAGVSVLVVSLVLGSAWAAIAVDLNSETTSQSVSGTMEFGAEQSLIQRNTKCPNGKLYKPDSGICAPIIERTAKDKTYSGRHANSNPLSDFAMRRRQRVLTHGIQSSNLPVPEAGQAGIAAGVIYSEGQLEARDSATLYTKMFVYPDGIDPTVSTGWYLFTVATNRTEKSIELFALYSYDTKNLGVFDWSCSPDYPCANGETGPSHQIVTPLTDYECNMTQLVDGDCNLQTAVYYANRSRKLDNQNPPLWENILYLWNYCSQSWEVLYSHEFRVNQKDCSLDSSCVSGWWGPILETPGNVPMIKTLGFQDTLLLHDGIWSTLTDSETAFRMPSAPWTLLYHDPNQSFTVGNFTTVVATNEATDIMDSSATLNATANADNENTTVSFEWGLTTSYGHIVQATPNLVTAVCTTTAVTAALVGLDPNTTYHYRAKGVNSAGTTYGRDMTLTTADSPGVCR